MEPGHKQLYDAAPYYDLAFSWHLYDEAEFLVRALKYHGVGAGQLKRVLEPACGTGRMLRQLAQRGFAVEGYDLNRPSVEYARARLREDGYPGEVRVADLATAEHPTEFDGAYNLLNGLAYLTEDDQVIAHLTNIAGDLVWGAVYIVQLTLTDPDRTEYEPQVWTREAGDVRVTMTWGRKRQDWDARINYDYSILEVEDAGHGRRQVFEDEHAYRMWSTDDLFLFFDAGPDWSLVAIYDGDQRPVKLDAPDLDKLHIPYFVLKRT